MPLYKNYSADLILKINVCAPSLEEAKHAIAKAVAQISIPMSEFRIGDLGEVKEGINL